MITAKRWSPDLVGLIHWSDYWGTYSLVLDVDLNSLTITELDSFPEIGGGTSTIRRHSTALNDKDKFYTAAEFYQLCRENKINARDVNNRKVVFTV